MNGEKKKLNHAVIITKSTNFEPRAEIVGEYLKSRGSKVTYIFSDFSHREKKKLNRNASNHIYIDTFPYRKNLSWQRIWSQIDFARKTEKILKKLEYDLLYVMVPGNSLVPMAVRAARYKANKSYVPRELKTRSDNEEKKTSDNQYKRKTPRLVFDVIDLWPESLRLGKLERVWPATYWKGIRDKNLKKADLIILECDYYREKLKLDPQNSVTMYWGKKDDAARHVSVGKSGLDPFKPDDNNDLLQIAYVGAINNIIDINGITALLKTLNRCLKDSSVPDDSWEEQDSKVSYCGDEEKRVYHWKTVYLHVIGDGENRDIFLKTLDETNIAHKYYGAVFDEDEKYRVLQRCSYGINMMRSGVCVGMTMKSIDYWSYGLPIINSIPGDTWKLCQDEGMGINIEINPLKDRSFEQNRNIREKDESIEAILNGKLTDYTSKQHIRKVFDTQFTEYAMKAVLDKYLFE